MKKKYWWGLISFLIILTLSGCKNNKNTKHYIFYDGPIKLETNMFLKSTVFLHEEKIPLKYSCDGIDINPPLQFFSIPNNAKSLVLIVDDSDTGNEPWVHWLLWNINPKITEIKEGVAPVGAIEGVNDFNIIGWRGPCPPNKEHRYNFKLYALDNTLNINKLSRKANLVKAMQGHILQQAILSGYYSRK